MKIILLLFVLLFTLSCGSTSTVPSELTFLDIADKLLVLSDGSYVSNPYSENGEKYEDPQEWGTKVYTFVEEISKTKKIYRIYPVLPGRDYYRGHEIKSDSLYVTDSPVNNINDIDWEDTSKVGSFVSSHSVPFLNSVKGKRISGCENYFDYLTGRTYIGKGNALNDKFNFRQARSATEAIYEHSVSVNFIGLSIVDGYLRVTDENATSINAINWNSYTNAGRLLNNSF